MQFSTKIDGFKQKDSQGFENSYNSYEQYPLEKFFIFTIYQNYTLALKVLGHSVGLCKTTKRKGKLFIILLVDVWRIICENFNPIRLILEEIWMKI